MKSSNKTKALRKLTLATTTAAMAIAMVSAIEGYAQTGGTYNKKTVQDIGGGRILLLCEGEGRVECKE